MPRIHAHSGDVPEARKPGEADVCPSPDKRATWRRMTLGEAAERGNPIVIWCNNKACGHWLEHGRQYRATPTAADLAAYVERYGEAVTFEDFRVRLRCRHCGSGDVSTIVDTPYVPPAER